MSSDIKSLADVQPGGRVRLGDQAERARFEAWAEERELDTAKCSADGMKGDYADLNTDWCWAAWRAALSAQPSPGGQEDALRVIAERLRGAGANLPAPPITGTISGSMVTGLSIALALVEEALAARQPAKQPDSVALGEATEFCIEKGGRQPVGATDKDSLTVGGGQAVGQEPVGFVLYEQQDKLVLFKGSWETDERWFWPEREQAQAAADRLHETHGFPNGYWLVTPVSATPPTQAVDLGMQLDRYDAGLLGDGGGGDVGWWQDYIRAELDRAHEFYQDQADSQAVGK